MTIIGAKIALIGTVVAAIVGATATVTAALLQRGNRTEPISATASSHPDRASTTAAPATTTPPGTAAITTTTPASKATPTTRQAPPVFHVVYKITGSAPGTTYITYKSDGDGSIQQDTDATVPWSKEFDLPIKTFAQVSAQNSGGGTITCNISVNGKTIKAATSTGQYAIVSCNATIGER